MTTSVLLGVERDVADLERRRRTSSVARSLAASRAQHGAHAGDQLAQPVRLGDVVVGADLEADDRVDLGALGRDHDDRHLALLAQLAAHVDARDLRQHHVEQHEVGLHAVEDARAPRRRRGRPRRGSPRVAARPCSASTKRLLVLDDEHGAGCPTVICSPSPLLTVIDARGRSGWRRQPQRERGALALARRHPHLAAVVGGDVAHDRQPETGAAGLAAAGPVDPVEALEDPLEVAGRDADAVVARPSSRPSRRPVSARDLRPRRRRREYFTALSSRLQSADTSWRRSPHHREPPAASSHDARSRCRAARRARGPARPPRRSPTVDAARARCTASPSSSIRDSSSRSSIVRASRSASSTIRSARRSTTSGSSSSTSVSASSAQRADRRLQLVADVGDEVGAHGVEPRAARSRRRWSPAHRPDRRRSGSAAQEQRASRRAEQLERLAARPPDDRPATQVRRPPPRRARRRGGRRRCARPRGCGTRPRRRRRRARRRSGARRAPPAGGPARPTTRAARRARSTADRARLDAAPGAGASRALPTRAPTARPTTRRSDRHGVAVRPDRAREPRPAPARRRRRRRSSASARSGSGPRRRARAASR